MANRKIVYLFPCLADKRKTLIKAVEEKYPSIKIVPITCAGRFNTSIALKLIHEGALGVVVLGCSPGDCHYREGSVFSERRFYLTKHTLKAFGIPSERFQAIWHKPSDVKNVIKELDLFMSQLSLLEKKGDEK